jgi:methionine--tRNA ligase beta chain
MDLYDIDAIFVTDLKLPQDEDAFHLLDIRIGLVVEVADHPNADKLYVEKVDVGDADPLTIVSGLRAFIKAEHLKGSLVLVLCNIEPQNIEGVDSIGEVLCCSNSDNTQLSLISPSVKVKPGTRVSIQGTFLHAKVHNMVSKSFWKSVLFDFRVVEWNGMKIATYKEIPLQAEDGVPLISKLTGSIE